MESDNDDNKAVSIAGNTGSKNEQKEYIKPEVICRGIVKRAVVMSAITTDAR